MASEQKDNVTDYVFDEDGVLDVDESNRNYNETFKANVDTISLQPTAEMFSTPEQFEKFVAGVYDTEPGVGKLIFQMPDIGFKVMAERIQYVNPDGTPYKVDDDGNVQSSYTKYTLFDYKSYRPIMSYGPQGIDINGKPVVGGFSMNPNKLSSGDVTVEKIQQTIYDKINVNDPKNDRIDIKCDAMQYHSDKEDNIEGVSVADIVVPDGNTTDYDKGRTLDIFEKAGITKPEDVALMAEGVLPADMYTPERADILNELRTYSETRMMGTIQNIDTFTPPTHLGTISEDQLKGFEKPDYDGNRPSFDATDDHPAIKQIDVYAQDSRSMVTLQSSSGEVTMPIRRMVSFVSTCEDGSVRRDIYITDPTGKVMSDNMSGDAYAPGVPVEMNKEFEAATGGGPVARTLGSNIGYGLSLIDRTNVPQNEKVELAKYFRENEGPLSEAFNDGVIRSLKGLQSSYVGLGTVSRSQMETSRLDSSKYVAAVLGIFPRSVEKKVESATLNFSKTLTSTDGKTFSKAVNGLKNDIEKIRADVGDRISVDYGNLSPISREGSVTTNYNARVNNANDYIKSIDEDIKKFHVEDHGAEIKSETLCHLEASYGKMPLYTIFNQNTEEHKEAISKITISDFQKIADDYNKDLSKKEFSTKQIRVTNDGKFADVYGNIFDISQLSQGVSFNAKEYCEIYRPGAVDSKKYEPEDIENTFRVDMRIKPYTEDPIEKDQMLTGRISAFPDNVGANMGLIDTQRLIDGHDARVLPPISDFIQSVSKRYYSISDHQDIKSLIYDRVMDYITENPDISKKYISTEDNSKHFNFTSSDIARSISGMTDKKSVYEKYTEAFLKTAKELADKGKVLNSIKKTEKLVVDGKIKDPTDKTIAAPNDAKVSKDNGGKDPVSASGKNAPSGSSSSSASSGSSAGNSGTNSAGNAGVTAPNGSTTAGANPAGAQANSGAKTTDPKDKTDKTDKDNDKNNDFKKFERLMTTKFNFSKEPEITDERKKEIMKQSQSEAKRFCGESKSDDYKRLVDAKYSEKLMEEQIKVNKSVERIEAYKKAMVEKYGMLREGTITKEMTSDFFLMKTKIKMEREADALKDTIKTGKGCYIEHSRTPMEKFIDYRSYTQTDIIESALRRVIFRSSFKSDKVTKDENDKATKDGGDKTDKDSTKAGNSGNVVKPENTKEAGNAGKVDKNGTSGSKKVDNGTAKTGKVENAGNAANVAKAGNAGQTVKKENKTEKAEKEEKDKADKDSQDKTEKDPADKQDAEDKTEKSDKSDKADAENKDNVTADGDKTEKDKTEKSDNDKTDKDSQDKADKDRDKTDKDKNSVDKDNDKADKANEKDEKDKADKDDKDKTDKDNDKTDKDDRDKANKTSRDETDKDDKDKDDKADNDSSDKADNNNLRSSSAKADIDLKEVLKKIYAGAKKDIESRGASIKDSLFSHNDDKADKDDKDKKDDIDKNGTDKDNRNDTDKDDHDKTDKDDHNDTDNDDHDDTDRDDQDDTDKDDHDDADKNDHDDADNDEHDDTDSDDHDNVDDDQNDVDKDDRDDIDKDDHDNTDKDNRDDTDNDRDDTDKNDRDDIAKIVSDDIEKNNSDDADKHDHDESVKNDFDNSDNHDDTDNDNHNDTDNDNHNDTDKDHDDTDNDHDNVDNDRDDTDNDNHNDTEKYSDPDRREYDKADRDDQKKDVDKSDNRENRMDNDPKDTDTDQYARDVESNEIPDVAKEDIENNDVDNLKDTDISDRIDDIDKNPENDDNILENDQEDSADEDNPDPLDTDDLPQQNEIDKIEDDDEDKTDAMISDPHTSAEEATYESADIPNYEDYLNNLGVDYEASPVYEDDDELSLETDEGEEGEEELASDPITADDFDLNDLDDVRESDSTTSVDDLRNMMSDALNMEGDTPITGDDSLMSNITDYLSQDGMPDPGTAEFKDELDNVMNAFCDEAGTLMENGQIDSGSLFHGIAEMSMIYDQPTEGIQSGMDALAENCAPYLPDVDNYLDSITRGLEDVQMTDGITENTVDGLGLNIGVDADGNMQNGADAGMDVNNINNGVDQGIDQNDLDTDRAFNEDQLSDNLDAIGDQPVDNDDYDFQNDVDISADQSANDVAADSQMDQPTDSGFEANNNDLDSLNNLQQVENQNNDTDQNNQNDTVQPDDYYQNDQVDQNNNPQNDFDQKADIDTDDLGNMDSGEAAEAEEAIAAML